MCFLTLYEKWGFSSVLLNVVGFLLVSEFSPDGSCGHLLDEAAHRIRQAPVSMEFSRQEYWSGLPSPSPKNLF